MKIFRLLAVAIVCIVLSWTGSVGYANYDLIQGLKNQDGPRVAQYIDFVELQKHLTEHSMLESKRFLEKMPLPEAARENALAALTKSTQTLIESTVNEKSVLSLFSGLNKWKELRQQASTMFSSPASGPEMAKNTPSSLHAKWSGFRIVSPNLVVQKLSINDSQLSISWQRSGLLSWKIVDIESS